MVKRALLLAAALLWFGSAHSVAAAQCSDPDVQSIIDFSRRYFAAFLRVNGCWVTTPIIGDVRCGADPQHIDYLLAVNKAPTKESYDTLVGLYTFANGQAGDLVDTYYCNACEAGCSTDKHAFDWTQPQPVVDGVYTMPAPGTVLIGDDANGAAWLGYQRTDRSQCQWTLLGDHGLQEDFDIHGTDGNDTIRIVFDDRSFSLCGIGLGPLTENGFQIFNVGLGDGNDLVRAGRVHGIYGGRGHDLIMLREGFAQGEQDDDILSGGERAILYGDGGNDVVCGTPTPIREMQGGDGWDTMCNRPQVWSGFENEACELCPAW